MTATTLLCVALDFSMPILTYYFACLFCPFFAFAPATFYGFIICPVSFICFPFLLGSHSGLV
jgi:hypothetical protein